MSDDMFFVKSASLLFWTIKHAVEIPKHRLQALLATQACLFRVYALLVGRGAFMDRCMLSPGTDRQGANAGCRPRHGACGDCREFTRPLLFATFTCHD